MPEGCMHYNDTDPVPFRRLHIDHLVRSKRGNTHILAISNPFSKYLIVKAAKNTKTLPVLNILNEVSSYFGLPKIRISDRGTAFSSKQFEEYCKHIQIQHIKIAVRKPCANGQVE